MNKGWVGALALPAIVGIAWIAAKNGSEERTIPRAVPSVATSEITPAAPVDVAFAQKEPLPSVKAMNSVAPNEKTESMNIKDLQALLDKDPAEALKVARRDFAKDPAGPDAAERYWVIVKSLAVLGHYEEARREAEVMVPKFRDTRWANDIERHILAHP